MIYLVTNRKKEYPYLDLDVEIKLATLDKFMDWWLIPRETIQLDTETNIVQGLYGWKGHLKGKNKDFVEDLDEAGNRVPCKRECYVVQIGDVEGKDQWIFDIPEALPETINVLTKVFQSDVEKLIHNGLFDYTIVKWCFGVDMKNIRDTFLMSQILTTGLDVGEDLPKGYHSLAGCANRILGIDLSKAEQTGFTGAPMTREQIEYAAIDVTILGSISNALNEDIQSWDLENVVQLECSVLRSYGDGMCENLYLDSEMWTKTMHEQQAAVIRIEAEFYELMREYFLPQCIEDGFIQGSDAYNFTWSSPKMKKEILQYLYPDMPKNISTVKDYEKYLKSILDDEDYEGRSHVYVQALLNRNFEIIENYLIGGHRKWLLEKNIYVPKDTVLINLNSPAQKLVLFKHIDLNISSTDKTVIAKMKHPLAAKLKEYNKATKMATSYGQNFLNTVNPDGMLRIPGITSILNTGRSSMKLYQLLPGNNLYRNPFNPNNPKTGVREDGYVWKLAGADYCSQELAVLATFANEPVMIDALENGYDLHSINTARLFPEKWKALGGEEKPKGKPEDKTLQTLRNNTKATIFGIAYGKSAVGLGESLNIPGTTEDIIEQNDEAFKAYMKENKETFKAYCVEYNNGKNTKKAVHDFIKLEHAENRFLPDVVSGQDLIDRVFNALPAMADFLHSSAEQGAIQNYIRTPDIFSRLRKFPVPESNSALNRIKRASQNYGIQGSSANCTKYAICLIKKHIEDYNLQDKIKFALPLHDELQYLVREDFAEEGLNLVISKMEEAAEFILDNKLLKAEGSVTDTWEK